MFLYIGAKDGLHVHQADATSAAWRHVQILSNEDGFTRFILHTNKKMLYGLHAGRPLISAFAIEAQTGKLRLVNLTHSGGLHPASVTFSGHGRCLLVAHAASSHLGIVPVAADGALRHARPAIALPGPARAQDVIMDPGGRFAVVTDPNKNNLIVLRFDPVTGQASSHQILRARPADAPHRAVFHPTMKLLYVSNAGNSNVSAYHWNAAIGRLSFAQSIRTIPSDWPAKNIAADIAIGADGRYLYLANRGHDSLAIFAIQPGRGKLFMRAREALGRTPHGLAWNSDRTRLLVANRDSNSIARYAVILANGMLTRQEPDLPADQPTAIALLD